MGKAEFQRAHPDVYYLDTSEPADLDRYLRRRGWITTEERITGVEPAGDGQTNCTIRVKTGGRSFILKQSRPWVERLPHLPAPAERVLVEGHFYTLVLPRLAVSRRMPQLLGLDPASLMMMLEDVGPARSLLTMYGEMGMADSEAYDLLDYLSDLHDGFRTISYKHAFENRRMRELNHEQIFRLPLTNNDLDLDGITPGLANEAAALKHDTAYVDEVHRLGALYLQDGPALLHGDFSAGSWLRCDDGMRVIDAELCFFGPPEFDLGVMAGHLILARHPEIGAALKGYRAMPDFDWDLAGRFAAVEMMRRLIGAAPIPHRSSLEHKKRHLNLSRQLMRSERKLLEL